MSWQHRPHRRGALLILSLRQPYLHQNRPVSLLHPGLLADDLPVPQLDLAALREAISKASLEEEALQLEQEKASTRYSSINDIRMRPFVRYRVRDSQNLRRDDVSIGVSLSIPFPLPSRSIRGMREIELEALATKRKRQNLRRQAEMMGFFYEYREKVEDWLTTRYQLAAIEEGLRREVAKADLADPNYQLRDSVLILRNLGKTELRLLDIKQILYLTLAGMFQFLPDEDVSRYFTGVFEPKIGSHRNRVRPGRRSIFLSSTTLEELPNSELFHVFAAHSIDRVLIGLVPERAQQKLGKFVAGLRERSIAVSAVVEQFMLRAGEGRDAYLGDLFRSGFTSLHLNRSYPEN